MSGIFSALTIVAEHKIEEAIAEGVFDNLPGQGRPLALEDLSHLPPHIRMAYTILKNSGYLSAPVPPGQPAGLPDLLSEAPDEGRVYNKMRRLKVRLARMRRAADTASEDLPDRLEDSPYLEKLLDKM